MILPGMPKALASDWRQLTALIDAAGERQPIPCRAGTVPPDAWTSDLEAEQARAAVACRRCAVMVRCRAFGLAHPREHGVYGALTQDQRQALARARKESRNAT